LDILKLTKRTFNAIKLATVILVLSGCAITTDFVANKFLLSSEGVRQADYSVTKETISFKTSDGVKLVADIYHPKGLKKTPTILVRIPLSDTISNQARSGIIARYWASRGYTVVLQGTRGRYKSGGEFYPLMHEREDGIQTLKWVASQPWYNGRLAMWGGSAFGYTQWAVADQKNPSVNAFFIQIASSNFYKMFYPGNAFSLESAINWAIRSRGKKDRDVDLKDLDRGVNHLPTIEADDEAIGDTNFFNDWALNTQKNDYWKKIDGEHRAQTIQAPVLLMAGWFDPFLPTQLEDFSTIATKAKPSVAKETRLVIGPWGHAKSVKLPNSNEEVPYRSQSVTQSIAWFDYVLGITNAPLNMPKVKIFVMGENRWRDENQWPLARTKYVPFYLHSNGKANTLNGDGFLSISSTNDKAEHDAYIYDPTNPVPTAGGAMLSNRAGIELQNTIEERPDVLVYTTAALSKKIEVTGPIKAILYVSTDAPSTDFTAKLVDVHPDGLAYNLSDGILRQTYKASNGNAPTKIEIELWPTSNVFLKGHKIRLEVSSSNFPRYDRNLNTGEFIPTATKSKVAKQKIFHTKEYPSQLILPVIPESREIKF
jgi:putative CocE/NonD family hydrolase